MTDADLLAYLDEALPAGDMTRIEQALRTEPLLSARLAQLLVERDAGLHTLSAIWRRERVSCPSRSQLGSYLLDVLVEAEATFVRQHLEVTGCRYCQANLEDLRGQPHETAAKSQSRRQRYFQSSVGHLRTK